MCASVALVFLVSVAMAADSIRLEIQPSTNTSIPLPLGANQTAQIAAAKAAVAEFSKQSKMLQYFLMSTVALTIVFSIATLTVAWTLAATARLTVCGARFLRAHFDAARFFCFAVQTDARFVREKTRHRRQQNGATRVRRRFDRQGGRAIALTIVIGSRASVFSSETMPISSHKRRTKNSKMRCAAQNIAESSKQTTTSRRRRYERRAENRQ